MSQIAPLPVAACGAMREDILDPITAYRIMAHPRIWRLVIEKEISSTRARIACSASVATCFRTDAIEFKAFCGCKIVARVARCQRVARIGSGSYPEDEMLPVPCIGLAGYGLIRSDLCVDPPLRSTWPWSPSRFVYPYATDRDVSFEPCSVESVLLREACARPESAGFTSRPAWPGGLREADDASAAVGPLPAVRISGGHARLVRVEA